MERRQKPLLPSPQCIASLPHRRPDVTPAPLGTGAAHLVIERVEVLGAIHRRAVSKRTAFSRAFLAAHSSSKAIVHLAGPLGAPGSGMRFRCHSVPSAFHQPPFCWSHVQPCAAGWGHGAEDRVLVAAFARRRSRRTSGLSPIQGRRRVPQITFGGRWWIFSPNYLRQASPVRGKYG